MNNKQIEFAFNKWWEKHQLGSSSLDRENAFYCFKYGYKAGISVNNGIINDLKGISADHVSYLNHFSSIESKLATAVDDLEHIIEFWNRDNNHNNWSW